MDTDDTFFDMKMKLMNKSSKQFYLKTDKKNCMSSYSL